MEVVQWNLIFQRILLFWLVETDFQQVTNLVLLLRAFSCWWTPFLKFMKTNFLPFFQFLTVEAVFLASGKGFFIECFILASGNGFSVSCTLLVRANFVLIETIIKTAVKRFFIEQPLPYYWKPFCTQPFCFKKFLRVKAAFLRSGNVSF